MTTNTTWHAAALDDLMNTSMSEPEIGAKYGRSSASIHKLKIAHGVVRKLPTTRRGPKRREDSLPLSRQHHAIGVRLNMSRGGEGVRSFADKLGVSPIILSRMEVGQHDFTLTQLVKVSDVIGQSIPDMMMSFENNLYKGRPNARS